MNATQIKQAIDRLEKTVKEARKERDEHKASWRAVVAENKQLKEKLKALNEEDK